MVSQVLHVVTMSLGTIMALTGTALFHLTIIVESSNATDDEDDLAVAFMNVQTR